MDLRPLVTARPVTMPSNHFDSTNVRCCTSPATLVPDATVLRRASSSLRPASFLRIPLRWSSSAARRCLSSGVTSAMNRQYCEGDDVEHDGAMELRWMGAGDAAL